MTASLRKYFGDDRIHVMAGHVIVDPQVGKHFFVNDENNVILVVEMNHYGGLIRANLGNTPGVWIIPDVGSEVLVGFDNGEYEGEAYVIGTYGRTNVDNAEAPLSLAPQQFNVAVTGDAVIVVGSGSKIQLISDTRIELASGDGVGVPTTTLGELVNIVNYLKNQFDGTLGHSHPDPTHPTIVMESAIVIPGAGSGLVPTPSGTEIVRVQ